MANTYLQRSVSSSGNRQKFTISFWVKRTIVQSSGSQYIISQGTDPNNNFAVNFQDAGRLDVWDYGSAYNGRLQTNRLFRDINSWYHIVIRFDTTLSTAGDRMRIYVNGEQETSFNISTNPSQNYNTHVNQSGNPFRIGYYTSGSEYFDGIVSHFHLCDGYSYAPTEFGETDSTTGEWKIKTSPSVSYGTNGFFVLKDGNSVTDQSGQGNNLTVAQGTLTKTEDCPSNVFATFNSLFVLNAPSTTNFGNTRIDQSSSAWRSQITTIGASSGKYYAEFKAGTISSGSPYKYNMFGVVNDEISQGGNFDYIGMSDYGWGLNWNNNLMHSDSNQSGSFSSFTTGDIISVAMDLDNYKAYWRKNGGAWDNSADPTSGSTGTGAISLDSNKIYFFGASVYGNECLANFGNGYFGTTAVSSAGTNASGNGIFEYDVPTGYTALSTKGLNL